MTLFEACGYTGQGLFMSRTVSQWLASERAGRSVVPAYFWSVSLLAAGLVLTYAVSDHNLVFVLSVLPGAVVAARNLRIRRPASRGGLVPWAVALTLLVAWSVVAEPRVGPPLWAAVGLAGTALWAGRHLFQWWVSERAGASTLPASFWVFSLVGSLLLLAYAVALRKPVMILGYAFNSVPAVRNLMLQRRAAAPPSTARSS